MDWDGIGTLALFFSSGAIGVSWIAFRAYQARLASKLEWARLERGRDDGDSEAQQQIQELEERLARLTERVDFTERLLGDGRRSEEP